VQLKAVAYPVDSRLLEIARHKVVSAAKRAGIKLKQTYAQEGKTLRLRIPLMADTDSTFIADSIPYDGGHPAQVS
jgi:hypothetical protein